MYHDPASMELRCLSETLSELTYIADSPAKEHGGFQHQTILTAQSALHHLRTRQAELTYAIELIEDLVHQACQGTGENYDLDSMEISNYVEAIRYLVKHGRIEIVEEYGRRVIARWKKAATPEPQNQREKKTNGTD